LQHPIFEVNRGLFGLFELKDKSNHQPVLKIPR